MTDDRPVHYALCGFHYGGQDAFCDRLTQNTSGFCDEHEAEIKQYRD